MADLLQFAYQYADAFALLALSATGLAIIFGMMGVINMAHGELMMIGAFGTAFGFHAGLPIPIAVIGGGLAACVVGLILERLVIRHLYGRLLYSLVATWGVSLVLSQGALLLIGPSTQGIPSDFGSLTIGGLAFSWYRIGLFSISVGVIVGLWTLLRATSFGLHARATMSSADMARALGVHTTRIYMITFGLGSFLAGLAGGLFALSAPVQPNFGSSYTPIAFIVVVVAGSRNIVVGLTASALLLALVKTLFTLNFNILTGYVAMLVAALIVIRLAPNGINELLVRGRIFLRPRLSL
jgi:branched-chain amino acid transport system permease protein